MKIPMYLGWKKGHIGKYQGKKEKMKIIVSSIVLQYKPMVSILHVV